MQEYIQFAGEMVKQPDAGLQYRFTTTYSADSVRVQSGEGHFTPLHTVETLIYSASYPTVEETKQILGIVAKGNSFSVHYFSPYYGEWRDADFYVKMGSLVIGQLSEDGKRINKLSFTMQGVNPID